MVFKAVKVSEEMKVLRGRSKSDHTLRRYSARTDQEQKRNSSVKRCGKARHDAPEVVVRQPENEPEDLSRIFKIYSVVIQMCCTRSSK
jgi:hypothetical protein